MSAPDTMTLLGCQIDIQTMTSSIERDAHLDATANKVRKQLSDQHADLVILPELSNIDYARTTFDCLHELAEPLAGVSFEIWRDVAREYETFISYGFARQDQNGTFICKPSSIPMAIWSGIMTSFIWRITARRWKRTISSAAITYSLLTLNNSALPRSSVMTSACPN